MTTQEQVTQADRDAVEAFAREPNVVFYLTRTALEEDWRTALAQAFARHRLTHTEPQDASRPSAWNAEWFAERNDDDLLTIQNRLNAELDRRGVVSGNSRPSEGMSACLNQNDAMRQELSEQPRPSQEVVRFARTVVAEMRSKADAAYGNQNANADDYHEQAEGAKILMDRLAALSEQPRTDAAGMREAWDRGYLVATGTLIRLQGGPCTHSEEILVASGITRRRANSLGLSEFDMDGINKQFDEIEERVRP